MINYSITETRQNTIRESKFKTILTSNNPLGTTIQKREELLQVFSTKLKEYRLEILGSMEPYRVILNGYRALTFVEMEGQRIPAKQVIDKMIPLF